METVLKKVVEKGKARRYAIVSVITTPHAIERLSEVCERLSIDTVMYTASIDPKLNDKGYIVPGLGDAGDRAFGG